MERKTPSAIVDRQILPRQTNNTETVSGEEAIVSDKAFCTHFSWLGVVTRRCLFLARLYENLTKVLKCFPDKMQPDSVGLGMGHMP